MGVGVESDFEVPEEGIPLKRLPRPKSKVKERTRVKGGDGAVDGDGPHTDDELVVRWSQDGGSPTSFRKLREQHKARRGSHSTAGAKREKRRGRGLEGAGVEEENGRDIEEFGGPLVGRGKGGGIFYTKEEERRVRRKMDKWLVGFLAGLYMLSFLDRSNIGNARIAGMEEDLNLKGDQYEWLLTSFYITYITFEWLTLLWRIVPAHKYIAFCVAGWGLVASIQALAWNWGSMMFLRALLGIFEAAYGPGVPFYLSFFYRREELALRTGLFVSAAPLATAYAGTLAYLITSIPSPLAPWRLLLITEGFPSLIVAVVAWYWIPDSPGEQRWLGRREREIARRRVMVVKDDERDEEWDDGETAGLEEKRGIRWGEVWTALGDAKSWVTALMFFSCNVGFSSLPVYLPTILNDMGYTRLQSQGLSAPPYLLAFLSVILTTYLSDRHRSRSIFIIFHALIAFLGYLFLALSPPTLTSSSIWGYLAIYPIATGVFSAVGLIIPWALNNQDTVSKQGAGMVVLGIVGQMGPLVGTRVYPRDGTGNNRLGMGVCALALGVVAIGAGGLRRMLRRGNERRDEEERRMGGRGERRMRFIL
ncbi:major facilitator superfamily domain-containing protein [Terfezia claveryi]|nr:major facilitator superfamily domain-containing protein [Terfezia claveryi]